MAAEREGGDREFRRVLGAVVRRLRQERGLTQEALAAASGCHVNHVSFVERGLRIPSLLLVFQLSAGLGIPPSALVREVELGWEPPAPPTGTFRS